MRLLRLPLTALVYLSVATVLAEAALLAALWMRGTLNQDQLVQILAVSQDVDLHTTWHRLEASARPIEVEQVSFEEVVTARKQLSLNLDLREIAADKGLIDVRQLDFLLDQERNEYDSLKEEFDRQLEHVQQGAVDESLKEVQRQLESVDAKLAKDQIMRLLEDEAIAPDVSMQFVVTMFKGMQLDKRKKILSEFKEEKEVERLHEILSHIRLGVPDIEVIRQTRKRLEAFNTRS